MSDKDLIAVVTQKELLEKGYKCKSVSSEIYNSLNVYIIVAELFKLICCNYWK